jgi:hypothetical protein
MALGRVLSEGLGQPARQCAYRLAAPIGRLACFRFDPRHRSVIFIHAVEVDHELPVDLFRRRLRVAPSRELPQSMCSVGTRVMVLAGHLLNSPVRNNEIRRDRLFSRDTNKNANKLDGCVEFLRVFSTRGENIPENRKAN